jgi:hypothetical protein
LSGKLNEGMFKESYSFVKDVYNDRIENLKNLLKQSKSEKDKERT